MERQRISRKPTEAETKIQEMFAQFRWVFAASTVAQSYSVWFHARHHHAFGLDIVSALLAFYVAAAGWSAHKRRAGK